MAEKSEPQQNTSEKSGLLKTYIPVATESSSLLEKMRFPEPFERVLNVDGEIKPDTSNYVFTLAVTQS